MSSSAPFELDRQFDLEGSRPVILVVPIATSDDELRRPVDCSDGDRDGPAEALQEGRDAEGDSALQTILSARDCVRRAQGEPEQTRISGNALNNTVAG